MTPERFRKCQKLLRRDAEQMARWLNADPRTVRRWMSGALEIPPEVAEWMEGIGRHLEQHPPPVMHAGPREAVE